MRIEEKSSRKPIRDTIASAGRGFAIGTADLIPGGSGATIALILGVYEKLMLELSGLIKRPERFSDLRENLNRDWAFLVLTAIGISAAVILGSFFIPSLVENHPLIVFSLFSGLIASSAVVLAQRVHGRCLHAFWIVLGAFIGIGVAMSPIGIGTSITTGMTIIAGFAAIAAMLIPGISGSYVLILLGYFTHVITAISTFDVGFFSFFALGAFGGALTSIILISRLLKAYHTQTMLVLLGIVAGALGRPLTIAIGSVSAASDWAVLTAFFVIGALITLMLMRSARVRK